MTVTVTVTVTVTFLVMAALICVAQSLSDPITCQAFMDQRARVTCHFFSDLNATRDSFIVLFYKPTEEQPYVILSCNWKDQQKMPECFVEEGVSFDRVVNYDLTAVVTPQLAEVGGHFVCQLVPSGDTRSEKCYLNQTDDVTESTTQSMPTDTPCPDYGGNNATAIVVTFFVTTLCILITFMFILWFKRKSRKKDLFPPCLRGNTRPPPGIEHPNDAAKTCLPTEGDACDPAADTPC